MCVTQGRLQKKFALVAGAAQRIGKGTVTILARKGAVVVVSDINDSLGQTVCEEVGGSCIYLHLDVSHEDDWKQAISTITK
jgi:NAD(P)-dependent dehydrogenase (short-subunit alcohol dehydrogenase family)